MFSQGRKLLNALAKTAEGKKADKAKPNPGVRNGRVLKTKGQQTSFKTAGNRAISASTAPDSIVGKAKTAAQSAKVGKITVKTVAALNPPINPVDKVRQWLFKSPDSKRTSNGKEFDSIPVDGTKAETSFNEPSGLNALPENNNKRQGKPVNQCKEGSPPNPRVTDSLNPHDTNHLEREQGRSPAQNQAQQQLSKLSDLKPDIIRDPEIAAYGTKAETTPEQSKQGQGEPVDLSKKGTPSNTGTSDKHISATANYKEQQRGSSPLLPNQDEQQQLIDSIDRQILEIDNLIDTDAPIVIDGTQAEITPNQPTNIENENKKRELRKPFTLRQEGASCVRKQLFETELIPENEQVLFIPLNEPVEADNVFLGEVVHDPDIDDETGSATAEQEENNTPQANINSKRKRKNAPPDSPLTKKRKLNPSKWKASQAKLAYNSGLPHISLRGKEKPGRKMRDGCGDDCRRKCNTFIDQERRQELFDKYWGLKDKMLQWYFLSKLTQTTAIKQRKIPVVDEKPFRNNSYLYFLSDCHGNSFPVCQKMFIDTFDISVRVVRTAISKNSPDKRGKHNHHKKLSPALVSGVKNHIKSFPVVDSHYCRADSTRKYLDEHLNVAKMHRLYLLERDVKDPDTASQRQYRDIFNTFFNLSFFKPKKDQCSQCAEAKNLEENNESYNLHQKSKTYVRELKKNDKILSRDTAQGTNRRVITCDMQKVLYCPQSDLGDFYYKRKLSLFNFTIFDCTTKEGHLYVWDLTTGRKGSDETSSFLKLYIENVANKGVTEIFIYSDSCSGQNKNQFLFTMFYSLAIKLKVTIVHRYLEKGHTQMECDSVHARVEKKSENRKYLYHHSTMD